tara:strand:+ start:2068 stop:2577 length:510 start_codon:yes stop_codon:yes gene_type:complete
MIPLNKYQKKFKREWLNPFAFSFYFFLNVPMGWLSGMKLKELSEKKCISKVPFRWYYRWQNMNPFKSMYFAVQCMAAELSVASIAALAVKGIKPSIAFIITKMSSKYLKKATGNVSFKCEDGEDIFNAVDKAISTKKGIEIEVKTIGTLEDGTVVSEFYFTWSFKQRSK